MRRHQFGTLTCLLALSTVISLVYIQKYYGSFFSSGIYTTPTSDLDSMLNSFDNSKLPDIVKVFHQSWKSLVLPPRFLRWSKTFTSCLPGWKQKLWTDQDNQELIDRHFPWFSKTFGELRTPVEKADAARLFYLYRYGGVYCDLDCECLQPFEHLLKNVSLAFGAMEDSSQKKPLSEGYVANNFIYSLPGHPFILKLINRIMLKHDGDAPEANTGPQVIMSEIHRWRLQPGRPEVFKNRSFLHIFPFTSFNPFSWITRNPSACSDLGSMSFEAEQRCKKAVLASTKDVYVVQYHTRSWKDGRENLYWFS